MEVTSEIDLDVLIIGEVLVVESVEVEQPQHVVKSWLVAIDLGDLVTGEVGELSWHVDCYDTRVMSNSFAFGFNFEDQLESSFCLHHIFLEPTDDRLYGVVALHKISPEVVDHQVVQIQVLTFPSCNTLVPEFECL